MKKLIFLFPFLLFLFGLMLPSHKAQAASANLIANPSVEIASTINVNLPQDWQTSQWGTLTAAYAYPKATGQDGVRSVKVTISSYTDGDAKWSFNPVAVTAATEYFYSDWSKSSVTSEIVVQYTDTAGVESFQWLGTAPVSTAWKHNSYQFTPPSSAINMTVYHLINSVGYLQTDNFMLRQTETLVLSDNVPNSSLEQTNDGAVPIGWTQSKWGTNTTKYSYLTTGHTGSKSVKVQMTKYTDGDAKWGYEPQPAIPGQDYLFTDYYQSNITTRAVVHIIKTDGTDKYLGLPQANASTTWNKYSEIFTMPLDAAQFAVWHFIAGVGYLITDDYSVVPYQISGFNQGMVSLTFDDGWEDNYTSVLPVLAQYGYKSTQYYATTFIQGSGEEYKVKAFADAGHEIGSHTITHPFLTKLTIAKIDNQLLKSKQYLESLVGVGQVTNFASPYGDYNATVLTEIQKYYRSHRSTDEGYNSRDNFNPMNIRVQNMTSTTTLAQYQEWLAKAAADRTWLVIVYHRVADTELEQFDTPSADFALQMQSLSQSGLSVQTVSSALDIIQTQL